MDGAKKNHGPLARGAESTAAVTAIKTGNNNLSTSSNVTSQGVDEDNTSENGIDSNSNTLWEQMTAREGRDAARRAGMRAGDWQAERQLQEALRESRQEGDSNGGASALSNTENGGLEERSFIPAGFHALATNEEKEEDDDELSRNIQETHQQPRRNPTGADRNTANNKRSNFRSARVSSVDNAAAAAAAALTARTASSRRETRSRARRGDIAAATARDDADDASEEGGGKEGEDEEAEDEEDCGDVELIVTQDGGIIPVAAAATKVFRGGSATGALLESEVPEEKHNQKLAKKVQMGRVRVGIGPGGGDGGGDRGAAATNKVRDDAGGDGGMDEEKGEEEEKEAEPLPPDIVLTLPDDVLHRTMLFLNPEDIFECRAVNSRWGFPGDEAVFEGLCRRTYLAQSAKKLLDVKRWRSWERMFLFRPRLRETGLYSLKTTYFKKPVRDMSTDWYPGKVLKVTYYRYFRFFGDGRVAYGLTHDSPREFVRMLQEGSPKVVYGTYTIRKWEVNVEIPNPWSWVNFTLQLANGERGRFTHLLMLRHSSIPRNDARVGRCYHSVKSTDFFTFRRVWQF